MQITELLTHALGSHTPSQKPQLIEELSSIYLEDGIILQDYLAKNRFGDDLIFTVANPKKRIFTHPVIAAHQTNEDGRKEVFSISEDAALNYGLMLARRGHRVFGLNLRWTGERATSTKWAFSEFCKKHPDWSPMGADCNDFQDLFYLMQESFSETLPVNWIGHSHGGVNGYILAASEPPGTFSYMVCNAAFLSLQTNSNIDLLPNLGVYFRKDFSIELWRRLDELLEIACLKTSIRLNCYLSDQTLHYTIPTSSQKERFSRLENKLTISMNEGGHIFPDYAQTDSALFIEQSSVKKNNLSNHKEVR